MALSLFTNDGKIHTFLYLGIDFLEALRVLKRVAPDSRIFCIEHGKYEAVAYLDEQGAKEFDHRVEMANRACEGSEEQVRAKLARDIESYKRHRYQYGEE
jgi:hypothetical protein